MDGLTSPTPRRGFLTKLAAATAALSISAPRVAQARPIRPAEEPWVRRISGRHGQVFDATEPHNGVGFVYALNFLDSYSGAQGLTPPDVTAIVVLRHFAMPLALTDAIWAKYPIAEFIDVKDPRTNAPARRNIFHDNIMLRPGLTYERAVADRGVIAVACGLALTVLSNVLGQRIGVGADAAKAEWTAGLIPGVHLSNSGVYAVNLAQEAGCAYCFAG